MLDSMRRLAAAIRGGGVWENAMRSLLYVLFVIIGALVSVVIGYLIEPQVSMTMSLIVFLALLLANFVASWIAVVLVMDRSLKDYATPQAQSDIQRQDGWR